MLLWTMKYDCFKRPVNVPLGTSVSMVVNPYKNQYKLILLSSDIFSFCIRDCCAQRVKLWSCNTELQPKDRSIAYALKQVSSFQVLKYSAHPVLIPASCQSALTCFRSCVSAGSWNGKGELTRRQTCSFHSLMIYKTLHL